MHWAELLKKPKREELKQAFGTTVGLHQYVGGMCACVASSGKGVGATDGAVVGTAVGANDGAGVGILVGTTMTATTGETVIAPPLVGKSTVPSVLRSTEFLKTS